LQHFEGVKLSTGLLTTHHTCVTSVSHNFMFNKEGSKFCTCYRTHPIGSDKWGNSWLQLSSCLSIVFEHCYLQCFHRSPRTSFTSHRHWQWVLPVRGRDRGDRFVKVVLVTGNK